MDITKIEKWCTSDGTEHESEELAIAYAKFQALAEKLAKDAYLRQDVDPEEIIKWITDNRDAVLELLS